ncbi:MAG: hypothetical protein J6Y19_03185 [Kiritimatiellae bacterium]|nr:hypothetical protein [Kiritimatiellia bacterium]
MSEESREEPSPGAVLKWTLFGGMRETNSNDSPSHINTVAEGRLLREHGGATIVSERCNDERMNDGNEWIHAGLQLEGAAEAVVGRSLVAVDDAEAAHCALNSPFTRELEDNMWKILWQVVLWCLAIKLTISVPWNFIRLLGDLFPGAKGE